MVYGFVDERRVSSPLTASVFLRRTPHRLVVPRSPVLAALIIVVVPACCQLIEAHSAVVSCLLHSQNTVEDLRRELQAAREEAARRLEAAVAEADQRHQAQVSTLTHDVKIAREEVERLRAAASAADAQWQRSVDDDRRRWQSTASQHEQEMTSLRTELTQARLELDRALLAYEESRGALLRFVPLAVEMCICVCVSVCTYT